MNPGRVFGPPDLALAEELARRSASAVDNAWLFHMAQEAARVREQFLSIASHELKTPVTVIQGYTYMLNQALDRYAAAIAGSDAEAGATKAGLHWRRIRKNLEGIEQGSRRLAALINELLDASRIQQQRFGLVTAPMDLSALLSGLTDTIRAQQQSGRYVGSVALELDIPETQSIWGDWDRSRLEQVFTNLIDNALKYSPEGGVVAVRLRIEDHVVPQPHSSGMQTSELRAQSTAHYAHVSIHDQGIGIPVDQQDQIFQPFVRATNASVRKFPGLGLGLSICKEIIERHAGRIWVESAGTDCGSTFHVLLPGAVPRAD